METALKWEPFIPAPIARSRGNKPELRPQKSAKKTKGEAESANAIQAETTTASRPRKKIACMARNSPIGEHRWRGSSGMVVGHRGMRSYAIYSGLDESRHK
jgi:hypothetical protein